MTTPVSHQKRTPVTILYRANPYTIYKTLLWAEIASRRRVLGVAVLMQVLFCLHRYTWNLDPERGTYGRMLPAPFDGTMEYLALGAMVYCVFFQGPHGFATRATWQSLALPVGMRAPVLVGLIFQIGTATVLGALWEWYRHLAGEEAIFLGPVLGLLVLAVQAHSAVLWCAAAGVARGLSIAAAGLLGTAVCAVLVGNIGPFAPGVNSAAVLVTCGLCSCLVAARSLRGDLDSISRFPTIPIIGWFCKRYEAWALHKQPFASAFRAQVWFEWRRSARWIVFSFAALVTATLMLETSFRLAYGRPLFGDGGEIGEAKWTGGVAIALALLYWYLHISITAPYRGFVFSRPHRIAHISAAKLVAAFLTAFALTMISRIGGFYYDAFLVPREMSEAVANESLWSAAISLGKTTVTLYFVLFSGPVLAFVIAPAAMVLSLPWLFSGGSGDDSSLQLDPVALSYHGLIAALIILPIALMCFALGRRIDRLTGTFPWELLLAFGVLPLCAAAGLVERFTSASQFGLTGLLVFGPVLMVLAAIRYGSREGFLLLHQRAVCYLALLSILWTSIGSMYPISNVTVPAADLMMGYFGALVCCGFVFYPLIIRNQREGTLWVGAGLLPQWALFLISPFVWLAFRPIGEEFSERGSRS